jgi:hypothetical protein
MEFKKGTFVSLEAQTQLHLGRLEKNLSKGDVVEYDGYTLKMGSTEVVMPELRGGVKRGWLKVVSAPTQSVAPAPVAAPAPVVAPAKETKVENVYDEERIISNLRNKTAVEETPLKKFPLKVESKDDDEISVSRVNGKSGASISSTSSAELAGGGIAESQGAESVATIKLKTASKQKLIISDGAQISEEMSKLENLSRDATPSKRVAREVPSSREEIDLEEVVGVEEEPALDSGLDLSDEAFDELEGFDEPVEEDSFIKEASTILEVLDAPVPPAQGAVAVGKSDSKVVTLPCGVDWDMSLQWKKRANLAVEQYGQHPEILADILAVEASGVVNFITKWQESQ